MEGDLHYTCSTTEEEAFLTSRSLESDWSFALVVRAAQVGRASSDMHMQAAQAQASRCSRCYTWE